MKRLLTSDIAGAVGVHPNTIRLYEEWGLLPKIPRSQSGYRLFSELHLEQARLVRMALHCTVIGREVKKTAYEVLYAAADYKLREALEKSRHLMVLIKKEYEQAEAAMDFLEQWALGRTTGSIHTGMPITEAAKLLDVTIDMLRDWERNGLINVPRNPGNGYRIYGNDEINRLRVIRTLRRARYGNMSILRVLHHLDSGERENIREVLNTPAPDEDMQYFCSCDRWFEVLVEAEENARSMISQLEKMIGMST